MSLSLWMGPNSRRLWNDTTFNRALHQTRPAENLQGGDGGVQPLLETSLVCADCDMRTAHLETFESG